MCSVILNYGVNSYSAQKNVASVMGALSSTSSSFGNAAASTRLDNQPNGALFIDDTLKQQALAEEEAAMNQYKVQLPVIPNFNIQQRCQINYTTFLKKTLVYLFIEAYQLNTIQIYTNHSRVRACI